MVLNPSESRRLTARAAANCPEVKAAWKKGTVIIARSITSAFVVEELFGIKLEKKPNHTVGYVGGGMTNANGSPPCTTWHVIRDGKVVENADSNVEILKFRSGDLVIKGGNAVDPQGNVGIWVASLKGGTIGMAWPVITPRGCDLIMPIGLEKLVPDVLQASNHTGVYHFKYSTGLPAKLVAVPAAKAITEIQAFAILAGVKAYHLASGGVGGSEGSVHLCLEGDEASLEKAWDLVKAIKGEPPLGLPTQPKMPGQPADYRYDPQTQLDFLGGN